MALGDFVLPIMSPSDAGDSGGGGNSLFNLSASVGLDASRFESGIAKLSLQIWALDQNLTKILEAIKDLASSTETSIDGLSTTVETAATNIGNALGDLTGETEEDSEGVVGALETIKEAFSGAAKDTAESAESMEESSEGAGEAAEALEESVDNMGESAEEASGGFDGLKEAASAAWEGIKNVAAAVWEIGTQLVDAASTYEQSMRVYNTAFQGVEEEAAAALKELSDETGLYEGIIRDNISRIQTQFRAAGYGQADALEMSRRAMMLAADAAAHYGISMDDATSRVLSFLRGNFEGGEIIGLSYSAATRDAYVQDKYGKAWKDLDEATRQSVLLEMAEGAYANAGVTGASGRMSDSFNFAWSNLMAQWNDIMGKLGTPIMEAVADVLAELAEALGTPEMQATIEKFTELLRGLMQNITDVLIRFIEWVASPNGQAAIDKIWGVFESILGWFGFGDGTDFGKEVVTLSDQSVEPLSVDSYSNVLDTIVDLINAMDRFYDMDYSDATDAEVTEAWNAYNAAMQDFLASSDAQQQEAMRLWLENSGITSEDSPWRNNEEGLWPEGTLESLPGFIVNILNDISSTVQEIPGAIVSGMAGVTVQANGVVLGHLVAPTVAADMSRNAKSGRYTTAGTTA